jgi:hypothetical protein
MLGSLISSDHQLYSVTPLKTPFGLLIGLFTIPITRNYNHSQLFLTLCYIYTAYNLTRSWLQSLIPLLQFYRVYKHYTLIFTALLHIKSPNLLNTSLLADFSAINYYLKLSHTVAHSKSSFTLRADCDIFFVKLSPRSCSANSLLKTPS